MTFLIIFLLVYGSATIYLGMRNFVWLITLLPVSPVLYWLLLIAIAASPIATRIAARSDIAIPKIFSIAGDFWLAITYWSVLLWLVVDLFRLADKHWGFLPQMAKGLTGQGIAVNSLLVGLLMYGAWNALNPVITRYDITINKKAGEMGSIKAVLVSDIHMGHVVGSKRIEKLATTINLLHPDIVFYAGDIIDDDTAYVAKENLMAGLSKVRPPLGSYAVLGNHEYIGGHPDAAQQLMTQAGIHVLRDEIILIEDAFYIAGRDDLSLSRYGGKERQSLTKVLADFDAARPVILLDHQPSNLGDAVKQGIDLQLSGHTHSGQFFPNNLVTRYIYEQDWGYLKKEAFQLIVSCGYGTWGPPVRLGNSPELVEITIRFRN